ncbi:MAG TPA: PPOX class F420-dependent oxidoreductase [Pseudonocardiaceae bacterium]
MAQSAALSGAARELIGAPAFSVLTTINADGSPQSSVMWMALDGDQLVFSTIRGRLKCRNLERDPRVSVCTYDPADPYRYVEVRGTVTLAEEGGDELIDRLCQAYQGKPWTRRPEEVRVVARVTPTRVVDHVAPQSASAKAGPADGA